MAQSGSERGERFSGNRGLLARLHKPNDGFDPSLLDFLQHLLDDKTFCGATGQFGIVEPHQPFAGVGFDRFGFEQIRN